MSIAPSVYDLVFAMRFLWRTTWRHSRPNFHELKENAFVRFGYFIIQQCIWKCIKQCYDTKSPFYHVVLSLVTIPAPRFLLNPLTYIILFVVNASVVLPRAYSLKICCIYALAPLYLLSLFIIPRSSIMPFTLVSLFLYPLISPLFRILLVIVSCSYVIVCLCIRNAHFLTASYSSTFKIFANSACNLSYPDPLKLVVLSRWA